MSSDHGHRPSHDETAITILAMAKTIAVVGASPDPSRASHDVMRFLQHEGYRCIPVNPQAAGETILGEPVVATLHDIREPVDLVDVFRRADAVPPIIDDAIAIGAKAIWLQLGISHAEAEDKARHRGLLVVSDDCPKMAVARLGPAIAAARRRGA